MVDTAKPVTGPWVISIVPVGRPDDLAGVPDGYIRAWRSTSARWNRRAGTVRTGSRCAPACTGACGTSGTTPSSACMEGGGATTRHWPACRISGMCSPTARRRTRWPTPRWPPATG